MGWLFFGPVEFFAFARAIIDLRGSSLPSNTPPQEVMTDPVVTSFLFPWERQSPDWRCS
jgi:hypothetical protein